LYALSTLAGEVFLLDTQASETPFPMVIRQVFIASCTGQNQFTQTSHGVHPTPTQQISMALLTRARLVAYFRVFGFEDAVPEITQDDSTAADDPPDPGDRVGDTLLANTKHTRLDET
jgi:hypothetical protein